MPANRDAERKEQRDALQQRVDAEILKAHSNDPVVVVQNVSTTIKAWIWKHPLHSVFDDVLASDFVQHRYGLMRHQGRPNGSRITALEIEGGGQLPLPGQEELIRWRWASRNGKVEKSVWHSTLPELDALDADYEARQIDMAAKRRYLQVLRTRWRTAGWKDPKETVEKFYTRIGQSRTG